MARELVLSAYAVEQQASHWETQKGKKVMSMTVASSNAFNRLSLPLVAQKTSGVFIDKRIASGKLREEVVPANVVGLTRDLTVLRGERSADFIKFDHHGDQITFCPPMWSDLGIGSGPCGLLCRSCFLMLTFRSMRDPMRHVLYDNVEAYWSATRRWLMDPSRRRQHTLGLGIDCSDSLLYEGVTGHARNLIPMFADPTHNPQGNLLVLLTKSKNAQYLEGLPTSNVAVTFSLNPEPIADLWEGKWPDNLERVTPSIHERLLACKQAQDWGFEVRWRLDPIFYPPGWEKMYGEFLANAAALGLRPRYITLGTYREKNAQLDTWREKWGLPAMEWEPNNLVKDGTHFRVPESDRLAVYGVVRESVQRWFPFSRVSLCKESSSVRKQLDLCNAACNCLV